jgi:hypothetical protein
MDGFLSVSAPESGPHVAVRDGCIVIRQVGEQRVTKQRGRRLVLTLSLVLA